MRNGMDEMAAAKSMAKRIVVVLLLLCMALGGGLAWGYWKYEPKHHFDKRVPVLAEPDSTQHANTAREKAGSAQENVKSFNILFLGIDEREGELARSDVIMAAHVDPAAKSVNLLSVPRDTRVDIPGVGYTKLNHAHVIGQEKGGNDSGTEFVIQMVSRFLDIPIHYYVKTDFAGFQNFIDTIGGIDVAVQTPVRLTWDNITIPAGTQHFNGSLALKFVRERYSLANGDFGRQADQALVLRSVVQKLLTPAYIPKLPRLIRQVQDDVLETNLTESDLISLAWLFQGMSGDQIKYLQVPGHAETAMDPLVKAEVYYWIPDPDFKYFLAKNFR